MALYLKSLGVPHKDICADLSISHVCLAQYLDLCMKEGLDGLKRLGYKGKRNLLDENRDIIIAHLEAQPPGTFKEAQARIEEITGIRRSLPQIQVFLKKTPFTKKSETSSEKANIAAQEQFRTETLEPLVDKAQQGKIELLFMDAAHFVLLPFLGYLYSLATRFIKSWSGRKRFSVLGAINTVTKELIMMTEVALCGLNDSLCPASRKLPFRYYDRHIVVVLDNARYQHCRLVLQTAERLQIQLPFLPPYSPNLTL